MGDTVNIGGPTTSGPNQLGTTWATIRAPAFKNDGVLSFGQPFNFFEDNENWGFGKPPDNAGIPRHPWYTNYPKYISSCGYPQGLDFLLRAKPFSRPAEAGAYSTCIGVKAIQQEYPSEFSDCYLTLGGSNLYYTGNTAIYAYYDPVTEQWYYIEYSVQAIQGVQTNIGYDYNNAKASLLGATVTVTINGDEFSVDITNDLFDEPNGVLIDAVSGIPKDGSKWWEVVDVTFP